MCNSSHTVQAQSHFTGLHVVEGTDLYSPCSGRLTDVKQVIICNVKRSGLFANFEKRDLR